MAVVDGAGTATGSGTFTGSAILILAGSATSAGLGTLIGEWNPLGAGTASGTSTVTGSAGETLIGAGTARGAGKLLGVPKVQCVPLPVNTVLPVAKTLRYMDLLQPEDLTICISNNSRPLGPVSITFTMFLIRSDGSLSQVGPSGRTPAKGRMTGQYYATGRVGESGQPGRWIIRWEFQELPDATVYVRDMCFIIQDAVSARDPQDATHRCKKYGWD